MRLTANQLPPGPRMPTVLQTLAWWTRPIPFLERCRMRHGRRFTIRLLGQGDFVMLSDPDELKQLFTAPPDVLHPGEGARVLAPVVGQSSVILLDEERHIEQRKLMLPAFHGERLERLTSLMTEIAEREIERHASDRVEPAHPMLQALTLEVILRAVFGLEPGPRLDALRGLLTDILDIGSRPSGLVPYLRRDVAGRGPWARFVRLRSEADCLIHELIDERRREPGAERDDVLAMLLEARHEDGSEMSPGELRDELMTLLVAGHETTASELAWALTRLAREPAVLARLRGELAEGGDAYLTATIQETLRRRPVLVNAAPRLVKRPIRIGDHDYPTGVCVVANAYLVHHDAAIHAEPYAFRPERFLEEAPGTYTWIPFGGGRRRCLGASFAMLEMKVVLRALLERHELAADGTLERAQRRSITLSPAEGARVALPAAPARSNGDGTAEQPAGATAAHA